MVNLTENLLHYLQNCKNQGIPFSITKNKLIESRWPQEYIIEAERIFNTPQTQMSPNLQEQPQTQIPTNLNYDMSKRSNTRKNLLSILPFITLVLGILMITIFMLVTFLSGKTILNSDPINLSAQVLPSVQSVSLQKKGNPFRVILHTNYQVKGKPFMSSYKLIDYSFSIKDSAGNTLAQKKGSLDYSGGSSDDEKSPSSISNRNTSIELVTFRVPSNDQYIINLTYTPNKETDIVRYFSLSNMTYEIKSNVVIISPLILLAGFVLLAISVLILIIRKRREKLKK